MVKELQALAIGDLHISGLGFLEDYIEDPNTVIYQALDNAVSYAKEHGIKYLFILGDIFDHPNPTQDEQKRLLRYLNNTGLEVHAISGNHDVTSEGEHSLIMPEFYTEELKGRVHIYTKPTLVKIEGIPVSFLPWPHTKPLTKRACLNIAHVTLAKAKSDTGMQLKEGYRIKRNPKQFWVIGDLHTYQIYSQRVLYQGMMYQGSFGEMGPKGFGHLTISIKDEALEVDHEFIITKPPFELVKLKIDNIDDFDKIAPYNKDDLVLYKLALGPDVVVPASLRQKYPNILDIDYGKSRVKKIDGKTISFKGVKNPLEGLRDYLAKEGLNAAEINAALKYSKQKLKELKDG